MGSLTLGAILSITHFLVTEIIVVYVGRKRMTGCYGVMTFDPDCIEIIQLKDNVIPEMALRIARLRVIPQ